MNSLCECRPCLRVIEGVIAIRNGVLHHVGRTSCYLPIVEIEAPVNALLDQNLDFGIKFLILLWFSVGDEGFHNGNLALNDYVNIPGGRLSKEQDGQEESKVLLHGLFYYI